jgi:hypothetical protein
MASWDGRRRIWLIVAAWLFVAGSGFVVAAQSSTCATLLAPSLASGQEFKERLHHEVSKSHSPADYPSSREFLFKGSTSDVYCNESVVRQGFNVEHTWPQSLFTHRFSRALQKSDLHHLFISDAVANSARGNFPFGEVLVNTGGTGCEDSKVGFDNIGNMVFEPPEQHKGAVARALFYFSIRYLLPISESQEAVLRRWHTDHPVTQDELRRNASIESVQGNRNPFIDHPEYVQLIDAFKPL